MKNSHFLLLVCSFSVGKINARVAEGSLHKILNKVCAPLAALQVNLSMPRLFARCWPRKMPTKINGVARLKRAFNARNARLRVAKRVLLVIVWAGSSTQESRRCKFFCVHYAIFALLAERQLKRGARRRIGPRGFATEKRLRMGSTTPTCADLNNFSN